MSLVNQVLRDLDARREAQPLGAALDGLRSAPPARRTAHKAGAALGAVALLGLAGALAWLYLQPPSPASTEVADAGTTRLSPALHPASPDTVASGADPAWVADTGAPTLTRADTLTSAVPAVADTSEPEPSSPKVSVEALPVPAESEPEPTAEPTSEPVAEPVPASAPSLSRPAGSAATPSMRKTPRPLSPAEQAEQQYADALEALGQGQWRLAEQALQAALAADPGHLRACESLSGVLLYQGRQREAEQVLAEGLQRHPQAPSLARPYARLILDQGRDAAAIEVLETALVNAAGDADYLALLAGIYQRNQRYAAAVTSYRGALSLQSERAAWWLGLGLALEGGGELRAAIGAYRSAIENPGLNANSRRFAADRLQQLNYLLGRQ